jgi:acyl-CoA thioesterase
VIPFCDLIRTEATGDDRFTVRSAGTGFLYGGLSMAIALNCAAATVTDGKTPLWLTASFLAGGEWGGPHEVAVERVNDSRSFAIRRVELVNSGRAAIVAEIAFHHPEPGDDRAHVAPIALPLPDELPGEIMHNPVDVGEVRPPGRGQTIERKHPYWARIPVLSDDPIERSCAAAFVSDYYVMATPFAPEERAGERVLSRTLQHSLWFHRPIPDDWWYTDAEPLSLIGGRFVSRGTMQGVDGALFASFTQCGFVRPIRPAAQPIST